MKRTLAVLLIFSALAYNFCDCSPLWHNNPAVFMLVNMFDKDGKKYHFLEHIEVNRFPIDHLDLLISNFRIMIVTSLSDVMYIVEKLIEFSFQRYALQSSTSENVVTIMIRKFEIDKSRWSIGNQLT